MKIRYETVRCGRCLGSGQYSYSTMYGSRCFGCGGSGKQLTRAGRKARHAISALREKLWGRRVADLETGLTVHVQGKWRRIREMRRNERDGSIELTFQALRYVTGEDIVLLVLPEPDQRQKLFEAAAAMPGARVIENEPESAATAG